MARYGRSVAIGDGSGWTDLAGARARLYALLSPPNGPGLAPPPLVSPERAPTRSRRVTVTRV